MSAMNARSIAVSILLVSVFGGCRQNQQMQFYIDNLNAEKRVLEDKLYNLQYDYEAKQDELKAAQQQLEGFSAGGSSTSAPTARQPDAGRTIQDIFQGVPDLEPPTIEFGAPTEGEQRSEKTQPDDDAGPLQLELGDEARSSPANPATLDRAVTHLYLNPALTGGQDQDGKPGDDGLRIVLEPRNGRNEFVREPGRVTVVLLDPKQRTRVARWEFDAEQTSLALQRAQNERGIQLVMPWKNSPPKENRLHLFVRYWPANGQAVQADREITLTPPGQLTATWTPRSDRGPHKVGSDAGTRPSDTRISVAEKPQASQTPNSEPSTANDRVPARNADRKSDESSAKQAKLPEWQPYR